MFKQTTITETNVYSTIVHRKYSLNYVMNVNRATCLAIKHLGFVNTQILKNHGKSLGTSLVEHSKCFRHLNSSVHTSMHDRAHAGT